MNQDKNTAESVAAEHRVLLADDVMMMRELLKAILRKLGFVHFQEAENGAEAVTQYQQSKPDILFIDIEMPVKNGWEALAEIRSLDPDVFIVMVSGNGSLDDIQRATTSGANAYVVKPLSAAKVAQSISKFPLV